MTFAFLLIMGNGGAAERLWPSDSSSATAWLVTAVTWPHWSLLTDLAAILASFVTIFAMVALTGVLTERDLGRTASFGAAWLATVCAGVIGALVQWLVRMVTTLLGGVFEFLSFDADDLFENPEYFLPYVGPFLQAEDIHEKTQYPEFPTLLGLGATWGALVGLIATGPAVLLLTHLRLRRERPIP
ncbi:hypothetical protein [Amycolatopsis sp. YIM 10]|uniref:hypothetical protein n=1 Tax=Amycolatopsis sp. YIM 10 TaxID=2653857 RepID=UPI0012901FDC|nr:hypothetical protein [Amycolatopsis sp. YIM 10]